MYEPNLPFADPSRTVEQLSAMPTEDLLKTMSETNLRREHNNVLVVLIGRIFGLLEKNK